MAINISFQPSAAAIGGAGLMGGNADFQRWRATQLQNAYQFAVSSALQAQQQNFSRQQAFSQLAAQQQGQQQQQQFELQKLPLQAQVESQQQAYQAYLQNQNQTNQALLNAGLQGQQSQQDFSEQQQILAQQGQQHAQQAQAQQQLQQEGQMQLARYQNELQGGGQAFQQMFTDPFSQHQQNIQAATQQGLQLSKDQQDQVQGLKNDITNMQSAVSSGHSTLSTVKPAFEAAVGQLNSISRNPAGEIPPPLPDQFLKDTVWFNPDTGDVGTKPGKGMIGQQKDPKTGKWMPIDMPRNAGSGDTMVGEDGQIINIKRAQQMEGLKTKQAKNATEAYKFAHDRMKEEAPNGYIDNNIRSPTFGAELPPVQDPQTGELIPYAESRRRHWISEYHRTTGGAMAGPVGAPPPPGGPAPDTIAPPGSAGAPQPPPAGIPAPGGQQTGMHFDPQRGPAAGPASSPPSQGPAAGSFQHEPPPETAQQIQRRAADHYVALSHQLPPEWKQAEQEYAKSGNHGGAVAVAGMWGLTQTYGPDASRWPPDVVDAAIAFRKQAPHIPVI